MALLNQRYVSIKKKKLEGIRSRMKTYLDINSSVHKFSILKKPDNTRANICNASRKVVGPFHQATGMRDESAEKVCSSI